MKHKNTFFLLALLLTIPVFAQSKEEAKMDADEKYKAFTSHVNSIVKEPEVRLVTKDKKKNAKGSSKRGFAPTGQDISDYSKEMFEYRLGYIMGDLYLTLVFIDKKIYQKENITSLNALLSELGLIIKQKEKYTGDTKKKFNGYFSKLDTYQKQINESHRKNNQPEIAKNTEGIRKILDTFWNGLFLKVYPESDDYERISQSASFWYYSHCEDFMPDEADKKNCSTKKFGNQTVLVLTDKFNIRVVDDLIKSFPKEKITEKQYEENFRNNMPPYFAPLITRKKFHIEIHEDIMRLEWEMNEDIKYRFTTRKYLYPSIEGDFTNRSTLEIVRAINY